MSVFSVLIDLVFPPHCEVCKSFGKEVLCGNCLKKINYLEPSAFSHSVGVYEGVLKKAILKYKFKRRLALSDPLGALMVKYIERNMYMKMIDLIVPVPLHHSRMKERGFNQAEFLAHVISKYYNVPTVSGMLFRVRETHPQFNLPKRDRFMNVRGAFEIKGSAFAKEKNILLVDDIYTTGATTSECTRVLKNSGASSVHVLTLSRALI